EACLHPCHLCKGCHAQAVRTNIQVQWQRRFGKHLCRVAAISGSQGIAPLPQLNQALRSDAMPGSRGCDHQAPSQIVSRNMKAQMRRMNVGIGNAFSTVHAASLRSKKGAKAPDGIETGSYAQDQTIYARSEERRVGKESRQGRTP